MKWINPYLILCVWLSVEMSSYAQTCDSALFSAGEMYRQNNYSAAQEKYLEVLRKAGDQRNYPVMVRSSLSLAKCHYYLYDRYASLKWCYNALKIAEKHKVDSLLSDVYYFLGALHIEAGRVDSAEKYSNRAIELAKIKGDYSRVSQTYSTLAELHLNTSGDPRKIESMIANAERYADLAGSKSMMAFAKSKRYNYAFYRKKNYHEALNEINASEALYLQTGEREAILNAYRGKAECLIMLRDTLARAYMRKWFEFKDSVLQAEKAVNVAKYETLFETERKEQENTILLQENERHRLVLFMVFVVFLFMVALGLWWFNLNNLKKKKQELLLLQNLQLERERIARDLHDHVGGQLSFIIYSLDGISEENTERRRQLTEDISYSVRSVIASLRETIWAIGDKKMNVVDFSDKCKVMARALFKYSSTRVIFTESILVQHELNPLLGLNLYRICQEILNNAFKYSHASEIVIELKCDSTGLSVLIGDNGVGFDTDGISGGGYGMQNIRERAAESGISLALESQPGKGTCYNLRIPVDQ